MTINNHINQLKDTGRKTSTFYFKHFKVEDGRSTMKVGTDAVLLGVVADVENAGKILEIGTGCGVIALILAQRCPAQIDAIEIDAESAVQARENIANSPWEDRINVIHSSLQDFIHQTAKKYDLVICNPPYFSRSLKSPDIKRNISRHDDTLSFEQLIKGSLELMLPGASLWVILPMNTEREFMEKAIKTGLYIHSRVRINHKQGEKYQRIILQLRKLKAGFVVEKELSMKNEDDSFTPEYIDLKKEFYLDF
jgi:tRNA1Val (adenine37-N6)-methyltransferase